MSQPTFRLLYNFGPSTGIERQVFTSVVDAVSALKTVNNPLSLCLIDRHSNSHTLWAKGDKL